MQTPAFHREDNRLKHPGQIERMLSQFFQTQMFMESQAEKVKLDLLRLPEFNLYHAFSLFDKDKKGAIDLW